MNKIVPLFLMAIMLLVTASTAQAAGEYLYMEKVSGYSRVDGETLRWDEKREFIIDSYQLYNVTENQQTKQYVNISMTDDTVNGILHEVTQPVNRVNFVPIISFWENGDLKEVLWDVNLFRIPSVFNEPFTGEDVGVLSDFSLGSRRFDIFVDEAYFTAALQYIEYHEIDGERIPIRVNTELTSDNLEDGRTFRSSINIIKRTPDGEILFDWSKDVIEVNRMYRMLNLLDQPFLWVPAQLGVVFLVVYIYIRLHNFWVSNGYKIVKEGDGDPSSSDEDEEHEEPE